MSYRSGAISSRCSTVRMPAMPLPMTTSFGRGPAGPGASIFIAAAPYAAPVITPASAPYVAVHAAFTSGVNDVPRPVASVDSSAAATVS